MTPQDLVAALADMNEQQGRHLLQTHVPLFSNVALDRLVYTLKRAADRSWNSNVRRSFILSGHLMLVGDLTRNASYHALGLMARGDALRRMDRDQEALPFFDAAGEAFLAQKDEVGWARTRIGRISACLRLNRPTEALRDARDAHDIFIRYGKLRRAGQVDVNAAMINFELGQHDQALHLFDRAIETYLLLGDGVDLPIARACGNKALTLAAQGKFIEAIALHEQARATFIAYGVREEISVAREDLNIAEIYAAQSHYSQALQLYHQSRSLFQQHAMPFAALEVAQQICHCLIRLNRIREAYELAAETVQSFRTSPGQRHNLARSLMQQADAAMLEGSLREADALLQEATYLLQEDGFVLLASLARLRCAELYFVEGQLEASMREAEYAADTFAEQENLPCLARALLLQARIADARSDVSTSYDLCEQVLDIAQGLGLLDLKYRSYDLLGQLAEQLGDSKAAASYYDLAVQGIDEVQSRLILDERTSFLEDKGGIYQRAMLLALQRGSIALALNYVEKAKSRVLGDYLRNNIAIGLRADDIMGEAMLDDLARLREEQAWFSSIVYHTEHEVNLSDSAVMRMKMFDPAKARKEMQKRERHIEQLVEKIQLRSADDLASRPLAQWTDSITSSLCLTLDATTLLLEYYLTDQDIYIFQLTQSGVNVHRVIGAVSKLERLLSLWRANLDLVAQTSAMASDHNDLQRLQQNGLGLLQRLYDLLILPIVGALRSCEHLIIVPYGMLHYLPFHSLFDGQRFLIERLQLSYLPSAALLEICHQRGQRVLEAGLQLPNSLVLGLSDSGRLTHAAQEAETVARLLGAPCLLNEAATSTVLWKMGPYSPIVHIAAHGHFRLDAPNFSYIKLADRQLSTIEVFNLKLTTCSLVVLSACETGRAVIGGVDEVIGLGRGFLYAGAASLLPTLWKVDDASSAELMTMLYQALLLGQSKAAALAGAQRAFLDRARTSPQPYRTHPYFWAAFHLIGDAGPLVLQGS